MRPVPSLSVAGCRPVSEPRYLGERSRVATRIVASAAAGLAALAVAAVIALFMLRAPYRDAHDGDSVAPHPETWWDVAFGLSLVTALTFVAVGLLALALALVGVVLSGEPSSPLRRHGPRITVLAVGAATYLFVVPVVLTAAA